MIMPAPIFWLDILRPLLRNCSGVTKIEYSLIAALVSVAVLSGASDLGMIVYSIFTKTSQTIEQSAEACGPGNGNGNCANRGNGGGNTSGSGAGTGNGGSNNGQGQNSGNGGGGNGNGGSNKT